MCDCQCVTSVLDAALQPTWDELWAVAISAAQDAAEDPRYVFEPIGLMLQPPGSPLPVTYDATPPDAITFASTGGDGVHFSASLGASSPLIVMTVPMQFDRPNVVLGQDLREFLSLGCASGYFQLEQLAYGSPTAALTPWGEAKADEQLALLRDALELSPWPSVQPRLEELQQQFAGG